MSVWVYINKSLIKTALFPVLQHFVLNVIPYWVIYLIYTNTQNYIIHTCTKLKGFLTRITLHWYQVVIVVPFFKKGLIVNIKIRNNLETTHMF